MKILEAFGGYEIVATEDGVRVRRTGSHEFNTKILTRDQAIRWIAFTIAQLYQ